MSKFTTIQIPNYTQYQLTNIVRQHLDNSGLNRTSFAKKHNIDEQILKEVLEGNVIYKIKHYDVVSLILNKRVDELIGNHTLDNEAYFRTNTDDAKDLENVVNTATRLFVEWIKQKKLFGEINSKIEV